MKERHQRLLRVAGELRALKKPAYVSLCLACACYVVGHVVLNLTGSDSKVFILLLLFIAPWFVIFHILERLAQQELDRLGQSMAGFCPNSGTQSS